MSGLNTEPKLLLIVVQSIGKLVDERRDLFLVNGIDLFPIDHYPGRLRVAQRRDHLRDKAILSIRRAVRKIFDRFRLPRIAHQISQ